MRRRRKEERWAAIFADDLLRGCEDLYGVFGGDVLTLPISIPIGEDGLVLLQPQGPLDAPRVPATMTVARAPDAAGFHIRIERRDGGPMRIPGFAGDPALGALAFALTPDGLTIDGFDPSGQPVPLAFTEDTARALANALLITIGMKLIKARGNYP